MLFLDKCVKTILLEEGQVLVSLDDLGISEDDLNQLFEGIYEQARTYIQKYVKKSISASTSPLYLPDAVSIKRMVYNTFMNDYDRISSDIPQKNWDFNPHDRTLTTFVAMSYIVEYLAYPKCGNLDFSDSFELVNGKGTYKLPCKPNRESFKLIYGGKEYSVTSADDCGCNYYFEVEQEDGEFLQIAEYNLQKQLLKVDITPEQDANYMMLTFKTLNYAIEEWDMKAEIFMVWFKAALLSMIGAIKEQAGNIDSASMPFDVNRDGLLGRARELYAKLDELKQSKSCWWEF